MSESINTVRLFTYDAVIYEGEYVGIMIPGFNGAMCILPDHAEVVVNLREGEVEVETKDSGKKKFLVKGGLIKVHGDSSNVSVFSDHFEPQ